MPVTGRKLFPVLVTGLHCGMVPAFDRNVPSLLFPVLVTGLHCGWTTWSGVGAGSPTLPGPRDRAPLRRYHAGARGGVLRPLFPVLVTGLHCGLTYCQVDRLNSPHLFPVLVTGLHCGGDLTAEPTAAPEALPGPRDRAPLRHTHLLGRRGVVSALPGPRDRAPLRQLVDHVALDLVAGSSRSS